MESISHPELDPADRRILAALQEDGTLSAAEVAERANLTPTTCWRRITQLENAGVIDRRVALLDRRALGLNLKVFAHVKLSTQGRDALAAFEETMREQPEVLGCYTVMGDWDFLLHIVARDVQAYETFYRDTLARIPLVQSVSSAMVMTVIKETTALPLLDRPLSAATARARTDRRKPRRSAAG